MNEEYTCNKSNVLEIYFRKNALRFYDLNASNITYSYWQVHEDLSIHLFLTKSSETKGINDFYLSSWALKLKKFDYSCGYSNKEIEEVFREDMEVEEKVTFLKISLEEYNNELNARLKNEQIQELKKRLNSLNISKVGFEVFKEEDAPNGYADYVLISENIIALLKFC